MNRRGGAVLALLAVGFGADVLTGRSELLVRPWFAGALLLTAVLIGLAALRSRVRVTPAAAFLLCLPVAVGVTLTPALAAHVTPEAADATTIATRIGDPSNPLLQGRGGPVTLLQILLAEQQVGGVALAGRSVELDAVVGGPGRLQRAVIVCCAADAQTVSVAERGAPLPAKGRWVHVTGRLAADGTHTLVQATAIRAISPPEDPFL